MQMTNPAYAIETSDVSRYFGAQRAVHQLSLRVPESGIYGFLGLNGAGKTTTIRLLLGLIQADAGSIHLFGKPFSHDLLRRIGSLVDMPSLYSHLTGRENLEVARRLIDVPRSKIDRADETGQACDLCDSRITSIAEYDKAEGGIGDVEARIAKIASLTPLPFFRPHCFSFVVATVLFGRQPKGPGFAARIADDLR